jgi:hypothetical protein
MNAEHDKKWLVARRDFLKSSAALGVAAAYGLAPTQGLAQGIPRQFDGSQFMLKPAEAILTICLAAFSRALWISCSLGPVRTG